MRFTLLSLIAISLSVSAQDYGTLHYSEEFNDNSNNWSVEKNEKIEPSIKDGNYVIEHKVEDRSYFLFNMIPSIDYDKQNFVIETRIKQQSGPIDQSYGLRFSIYKDYSNYRTLYVAPNGYYKVSHYYSEEDHKPVDWTQNKELVKGQGEYNILRIEREAHMMRFYINNKLIAESYYNRYFTDRIGFYVSGLSTIAIDYLKVWTSPLKINFVPDQLENVSAENLGPNVNSTLIEKAPVISPDGNTLFFVREITDADGDVHDDIYFSTRTKGSEWNKAENIGFPLNNKGQNSVTMVLPDNNTLLLMNCYKPDGSSKGGGLSTTKRSATGWEIPRNLNLIDYHNHSKYAGYALSPSGKVMILAAHRDETVGVRDLYVSFKQDDTTWSKPQGLGLTINTRGDEDSPFIAADDKTLYFSSNGHPGMGGSDVFISRRLDDTWLNWSEPQNIGTSINAHNDEYGFKIAADGEYAYFYRRSSGDPNGMGEMDLYRIALSESARPDPIVFVVGQVFDSETKKPLSAEIVYEDLNTNTELGVANSEPVEGRYQIALPYGKVYGFLARKKDYYSVSESIDLTVKEGLKTVKKDLYLSPIKKGVTIRLNNIFFEHDKSDLLSQSFVELNRLVSLLKANEEWKIEIGGHTDDTGSDAYNQTLSQKRASAVRAYLISQGISAERLTAKGYGEAKPIASNETEEGKAENRRVEFKIL